MIKRDKDQSKKYLQERGGKIHQQFGQPFLYSQGIKKTVDQFRGIFLAQCIDAKPWYAVSKLNGRTGENPLLQRFRNG